MHTFSNLASKSMNEIIVRPGESIQKAINQATPGTIIRVKAGTYREALSLKDDDVKDSNTTPDKPIVLISDDGPGKAIIKPPNGTQEPTLFLRLGNTVVEGFQLLGTADFDRDNAPLKIGSEEGNILIKDNYIKSSAEDVIKVFISKNISFIGNTLDTGETERWKSSIPDDNYLQDSAIDIVHVENVTIAHNDFIGHVATGITMKTGTHNVDISNNHFAGKYLDGAIKIGGRGDSFRDKDPWFELPTAEAEDIRVVNNVIEGEYHWGRVFQLRGGQNSIIEGNLIAPKSGTKLYLSEQSSSSDWSKYYKNKEGWFHTKNITFSDNVLNEHVENGEAEDALTPNKNGQILPQNQGFVEQNNHAGNLKSVDFSFGVDDRPTTPIKPTPAPVPVEPTPAPVDTTPVPVPKVTVPEPTPTLTPEPTPEPKLAKAPTPANDSDVDKVLQADDASLNKAVIENEHSGLTGSGYINFDNVSDSSAKWSVNSSGENGTLTIRYANGTSDNRSMTLLVNGVSQGTIDFNDTDSWSTWEEKTLNLNGLNDGNNVIQLQAANPNSGPNIDRLTFEASSSVKNPPKVPAQNPVENNLPETEAPTKPQPAPKPTKVNSQDMVIGEYGSLDLNHEWQTVALDNNYVNPVVIVSDPTINGADPAVVRLRKVTGKNFQLRLQEPNYKDGKHTQESASYMVMEAGDWILADGTRISAGTHNTNRLSSKGFDSVNLKDFQKTPTVLSQVQTFNGTDWVTTRTKNQSKSNFQLAMQEEEALNKGGHAEETVGWFAVELGGDSNGDAILSGGTTARR
ncbi:MAG: right-handed parallel beta-helix repeat-containing protein, partial [Cyanobacteria bacterium P01_C01_bin.118]